MFKSIMLALILAAFCVSPAFAADKPNLNSATAEEMAACPAIGPELAKKIVEYRENVGDFASANELQEVEGIDESKAKEIEKTFDVKGVASADCNC